MGIPAFPQGNEWMDAEGNMRLIHAGGMTLRDYFAAAALQGLCANGQFYTAVVNRVAAQGLSDEAVVEVITTLAADFADAMIAERNKRDD